MITDLTFLEEGELTRIDETVREIATKTIGVAHRKQISFPEAVRRYVAKVLRHRDNPAEKAEGNRTASRIIESGYWLGCRERAIVFLALIRTLGIPGKYVETFEQNWLKDTRRKGIIGHAFVDILEGNAWRVYDPETGFTRHNEYFFDNQNFVEVGKGIDPTQVYLKENGVYRPNPSNLKCLDEAVRLFK